MEREAYWVKTKPNPRDNEKPGHMSLIGASVVPVGPAGPVAPHRVTRLLWLHHPACLLLLQPLAWGLRGHDALLDFTPEMY